MSDAIVSQRVGEMPATVEELLAAYVAQQQTRLSRQQQADCCAAD